VCLQAEVVQEIMKEIKKHEIRTPTLPPTPSSTFQLPPSRKKANGSQAKQLNGNGAGYVAHSSNRKRFLNIKMSSHMLVSHSPTPTFRLLHS
jgi:hypothetical protein